MLLPILVVNKYHLIGNSKIFNGKGAENCSSLAHALLTAGGIGKLVATPFRMKMLVTPNNLAAFVEQAKTKEDELLKLKDIDENPTFRRWGRVC